MAIHRTEHKQNYTIISNRVINDDSLSWEARMVLIYMLSKPDDWTFSLAGITAASPRSKDSNGRILKELEQHGYLRRIRDYGHGKLGGMIYEIYEEPFQPIEGAESTASEKPVQLESRAKAENLTASENAAQQKPAKENQDTVSGSPPPQVTAIPEIPAQQFATQSFPMGQSQPLLSTEATKTERTKTEGKKEYPSLNPPGETESFQDVMDEVKEAICYDALLTEWDEARVDSLVVLIVNTLLSSRETIRIGVAEVSAELVKARLRSLDKETVDYVFESMDDNSLEIRNIHAYLLTALFNASGTMEEYYRAKVNNDFANPKRVG